MIQYCVNSCSPSIVWGWCVHVLNLDAMNQHFAIIARLFPPFLCNHWCNANFTYYQTFAYASLGHRMPTLEIQLPGHQTSKHKFKYLRWSSLARLSGMWFIQAIFTISLRTRCVVYWKCPFLSFGCEGDWSEHLRRWGLVCLDKSLLAISSLLPFPSAACLSGHRLDQCLGLLGCLSLFPPPRGRLDRSPFQDVPSHTNSKWGSIEAFVVNLEEEPE